MKPILLFDIDGTLLHVKRDFLRDLIHSLFKELNLDLADSKPKSFAGRTDKDIFFELIETGGLKSSDFNSVKKHYIQLMMDQFRTNHLNPIADALESVLYAKKIGYEVGLCTGNFEEIAYLKVEMAGLKDIFSFGGFGCNHTDRKHLPGEAHNSYQKLYSKRRKPQHFVVIGDTPNDIRCAKYYGARSIAVSTGGFDQEELAKYQPDLLLNSLEHPEKWLTEIQFTTTSQK